jgi:serine protease Do
MSLYQLPDYKIPRLGKPGNSPPFWKSKFFLAVLLVLFFLAAGGMGGIITGSYFSLKIFGYLQKFKTDSLVQSNDGKRQYDPATAQEEAVISAVKEASPAVISIIISKNLPIFEECYVNPFGSLFPDFQIPQMCQKGTKLQEIGGGSGFIISADGLILTNKHVVSDKTAEYTVLTNDGKKYPAKVLALDPTQDLALIKISADKEGNEEGLTILLPTLNLGDSDGLQIGQTVITIGNALGEFRNTVSAGVVSGLGRTITASGGGVAETIEDVIQTDAAINSGNSGGPLLNLRGEVVGINTAMVSGAQSIGFAIPINKAKKDIESVKSSGRIIYPFLGVRYVLINDAIKEENNLAVNYGAWVRKGEGGEPAVSAGSSAEAAGVKEGDIILEFNGEKITTDNSLAKIIMKYNPGDKVNLKILRQGKEITMEVTLGER